MIRAACILIVAFAVCAGALGIAFVMPSTPRSALADASDARDLALQPHPGARLPLAASLVDENGRVVTLGQYFGNSPVILVLDYLRCTSLCGVTLRNLIEALDGLPLEGGRDFELLAVSIDPRDKPADTLAARQRYAALLERRGGATGLHFLTATSPAAVREIADTVGFPYRYDGLLDAYVHPAGFVVATPAGIISRYIEGVAISSRELIGALANAEEDKSQGPLARLLLLCQAHGAALGRFTVPVLTAFTIANIAACLTVIAIFGAVRRRRNS